MDIEKYRDLAGLSVFLRHSVESLLSSKPETIQFWCLSLHSWMTCVFLTRFRLRGLIVFVALLLGISFTTTAVIYAHYDLPAVVISKAALDAAWEPIFFTFLFAFVMFWLFICLFFPGFAMATSWSSDVLSNGGEKAQISMPLFSSHFVVCQWLFL